MKPIKFEKLVPTATFVELWHSRLPDFRARNELRNLKHQGIAAMYERYDDDFVRIFAEASSEKEIKYLEKRGFCRK